MLGKKHPASFGKAAEIGWWEIWPSLKPLARQIIESGVSMHKFDDIQYVMCVDCCGLDSS